VRTARNPRSTNDTVTNEPVRMTSLRRLGPLRPALAAVLALACTWVAGAPASASAAQPWWNLNPSVRPVPPQPGGNATLEFLAVNSGDAPTAGPLTFSAQIPPALAVAEREVEGVEHPAVEFFASGFAEETEDLGPSGPLAYLEMCRVNAGSITCRTQPQNPEFESIELVPPLNPYETLKIVVEVHVEGALAEPVHVALSGGGAEPASTALSLSPAQAEPSFAAERLSLLPEEEGGSIDSRAGSHPFQLTNTFNLDQGADPARPPASPRDLHFKLPPGQLGNVTAVPQCSSLQFATILPGDANTCPPDSAIGVATITFDEPAIIGKPATVSVPLFNLEPAFGEPARFGFEYVQAPVTLDTSLRSGPGGDYGVTVTASNITQLANSMSTTVTFWGTPGDPRHDSSRGWSCLVGGHYEQISGGSLPPCQLQNQQKAPAFLTLPANCASPFATTVEGISWPDKAFPQGANLPPFTYSLTDGAGNPLSLTACNQVPFDPQIHSEPTSDAATSPTGLNFEIDFEDEGLLNPEGRAQSQLKKALVTLPEGFTIDASLAEGLHVCTEAEYEASTVAPGSGCREDSKVGEAEATSPLVQPNQVLHGGLYVAEQDNNPYHNLTTLYLVMRSPEIGVVVKQALKVTPDPQTGQLQTEVDNVPELPFSHFHLFFRPGQRAPLVTPPACGTYTVEADLFPWANPSSPVHRESSFQITQGPEGEPCPSGGVPPFHPNLEAGTINNAAGTYSPFYTHMTRKDSEQEITYFSIKLPPGVIGKLAGIPYCPDAGIAAAKAREREGGGTEEEASPSCPKASEVGHSLVGSGVGNVLAYAPGRLYLAGPYHGSNLSIVSITAAKVGPFDLGTVVVRFALRINPETAEVFVDSQGSDPIPHIVDGIPVHLRDIRAYVDRPQFVLNPTGCEPTSTASTVLGSGLNFASEADDQPVTVTSPFQAADCAALGFKPKLALSLKGGTKRGATPAFKAVLTYPKGGAYSNIATSQVTLPHSEFLDNAHIGTVCTRVQFKEGAVPGEKCPAASVYGRARAITPILFEPLAGPVYLRSSEHELPDLVVALHNNQVDIALDGRIDSVKGQIRNTFEAVPDAPVSKFVLEMQGGKKGLLENSTNLCRHVHKAIVDFEGHNGKVSDYNQPLVPSCGKHGKKGKHRSGKR
jgi:hypothetical protein